MKGNVTLLVGGVLAAGLLRVCGCDRDEGICSSNRHAITVRVLCGLRRLSLYGVLGAAKALGTGAWALLLQF